MEGNNTYNLTNAQKNIYMLDKLDSSNNSSYNNICGVLYINDSFNTMLCKKALIQMVKNNDAMQLQIFRDEKDQVRQFIKEVFNFVTLDSSSKNEEERKEELKQLAKIKVQLENNCLYTIYIIDYGNGKGAVLGRCHHIIADAWSLNILIDNLAQIYDEILKDENYEDNNEYHSYIDCVKNENEYLKSDKYLKSEMFWREYLEGIKNQESLSSKIVKPSFKADKYQVVLNKEITEKINKCVKDNKVAITSIFLAAISTYIYRIKNNNDVIIGTPVLNRTNFKEKQTAGMFISSVPCRINIEENMEFLNLASNITKDLMSVFRHQKYPLINTMSYVHKNTEIKDKLYNVVLSYQNTRSTIVNKERYVLEWVFTEEIQNELEIHVIDLNDTGMLNVNYAYLTDLFSIEDIKFMHERIMKIIVTALDNPKVNIDMLDIVTDEEKSIISLANDTFKEYDYSKGIAKIFEENVEKNKDKIAVIFNNQKYTYEYLNKKSNKLARHLKDECNVKLGDKISFVLKRNENILICMLASYKLGLTYIPIDSKFPLDRIEYMIENSESKLVIVSEDICSNLEIKQLNISNLGLLNVSEENLDTTLSTDNNISYMIYTSGTTGKPKGCMIYEKSILNLIYAARDLQKLNESNIFGSFSTYSFDISVLEFLSPLVLNATVVLANEDEQNSPEKLYNLINDNKIEIVNITPTRMKILLQNDEKEGLKYLKNIMLGGEVFPKNVYEILKKYTNADIYNGYGPTEITVWSSAKKIQDINNINIGKSLNNMTSYVLDSKNNICPLNVKGELCVGGVGVAKGYYNNEKLTNERFVDVKNIGRVYKTGDIVYMDYNGDIHYNSRIDNQIKLNGLRIEIDDIEKNIEQIENIENSAVIVKNNKLIAYFKSNIDIDYKDIINELSAKLPNYMIPKMYMKVDKFDMTTLGKVDKSKLPEVKQNSFETIILANTDIQKYLYEEIALMIDNDKFGTTTNLIEIGMDSLNLISLSTKISKKYNIYMSYKDMFDNQTILEIESYIIKNENNKINSNEIKGLDDNIKITNFQKSIVNDYLLNNKSVTYNVPFELKISSKIEQLKLVNSVEKVVKLHSILFCNLKSENEEIMLKQNDNDFKLNIKNVSEKEYEDIKLSFLKPFNLFEDRLFDIDWYNVNESVYILFDFNHLIFDGTSFEILLTQIFDEYNDIDVDYTTNNLLITYSKEEYESSKEFYLDKFNEAVEETEVKLDYKRTGENVAENVIFEIEKDLLDRLEELSKKSKVTLNNVYLGSFIFLLSKYTYNENITIGVANDARFRENKVNEIGMFVSSIPYRYNINLENSINEYLVDMQKNLLDFTKNNIYGYDELIKDLKYERQLYKNPLFNIFYVFQNKLSTNKFGNVEAKINEIKLPNTKMDIVFEVSRIDDSTRIRIEYNSKLYKKESIELFITYYNNLLKSLVNANTLKDIEIISSEEKNYILSEYNNVKTDYGKNNSVNKIIENNALKYGSKIALVFEDKKITYNELNEKANVLAREILKYNLPEKSTVALVVDKSLEYIIGVFAIIKCGYSFCPINLDIPDKRAEYMMQNANIKLFLTTKEYDRKLNIDNKLYIDYDLDIYNKGNKENLDLDVSSKDILYVLYTSGTTGLPKGTKILHKGITRLVLNTNYSDYTSEDVMLCSGSITFDASIYEIFAALLHGMTLHLMKKFNILNPEYYATYLEENNITTTLIPTPIFNMLVQNNENVFKTLKAVYVGGDTLLNRYTKKYINEKVEIINTYGPTENSVISTSYKLEKKEYDNIPIGKPISNSTCYIVDKCGKLSPKNIYGELYVGGDGLGLRIYK